jgi:uncharacterized protein
VGKDKYFDVAIVGSGPTAKGAAYELVDSGLSVVIIDKENYSSGGLVNDCKLNPTHQIGMDYEHLGVSAEEIDDIIWNHMDPVFARCAPDSKLHGENPEQIKDLEFKIRDAGGRLVSCKQRHVGTDKSKDMINRMRKELEAKDVTYLLNTSVENIDTNDTHVLYTNKRGKIKCKYLILAPGRGGSVWLRERADGLGINHKWGPIDVGVRIEMPCEAYPITDILYDPKIKVPIQEKDFGKEVHELVRDYGKTFCTNYRGRIRIESEADSVTHHGTLVRLVNGDARDDIKTNYTNFAVLYKWDLNDPPCDTKSAGINFAHQVIKAGNGKPVIQRVGDFLNYRRSKWEDFFDPSLGYDVVKPTMGLGSTKERGRVTPANLRNGLNSQIAYGIEKTLRVLDQICGKNVAELDVLNARGKPTAEKKRVMTHVLHPANILYGPEIKLGDTVYENHGNLETNVPNIYVAGNANNTSGIVGAWVSGVVAARGILNKVSERRGTVKLSGNTD